MEAVWMDWAELVLDGIAVLLLLVLWRSYRRHEPVAPQMYLFTVLCSLLFLGIYGYTMPVDEWLSSRFFVGPAAATGFLWGLISSRGMILFRAEGRHFLKGSLWVPVWATLNFASGKLLEAFGEGLWGISGFALMLLATAATVAANLVLLVVLLRVRRYYQAGQRRGGPLHFCHQCGAGYERGARRCPRCRQPKERIA